MPKFFCENMDEHHFNIVGEDAKHISKVLRYVENDVLTLCDMKGKDYTGVILDIKKDSIFGEVTSSRSCESEPNINVKLYMAMPKADKAEFVVQKAVELGANEIIFMLTHRCVSRPDDSSFEKKLTRFNKIAFEAAKQSGRGIIPLVRGIISYDEALNEAEKISSILFYENANVPLNEILAKTSSEIAIIIGSEGGFEEYEIEKAISKNIAIASLGKRILRCETAPIVAISAMMYAKGNF